MKKIKKVKAVIAISSIVPIILTSCKNAEDTGITSNVQPATESADYTVAIETATVVNFKDDTESYDTLKETDTSNEEAQSASISDTTGTVNNLKENINNNISDNYNLNKITIGEQVFSLPFDADDTDLKKSITSIAVTDTSVLKFSANGYGYKKDETDAASFLTCAYFETTDDKTVTAIMVSDNNDLYPVTIAGICPGMSREDIEGLYGIDNSDDYSTSIYKNNTGVIVVNYETNVVKKVYLFSYN